MVMDCVVTHPVAASYVHVASQLAGFAAAKAETKTIKCQAFELIGDGAGYEFLTLAGESYERQPRSSLTLV